MNSKICQDEFLELLEIKYQKAIVTVFVKYKILHIEITHKGFIPGLKFKSKLLLDTLFQVTECENLLADEVIVFCKKE